MYVYMSRWAISVECVCVFVSPHCLASCWAVGVECVCVSSLAGLLLGRRCGVCVFVSPHQLTSCWAIGVECPHWLASCWAGVECVCVSPHWLDSCWAIGVECVCVPSPLLGRRCRVCVCLLTGLVAPAL